MSRGLRGLVAGEMVECGSTVIPVRFKRRCRVLGLDPSGGKGPWGLALLRPREPYTWAVEEVLEARPAEAPSKLGYMLSRGVCVAGIDAPIGGFEAPALRSVDRAARSLGAKVLPLWRGMRYLAVVGSTLASMLRESGVIVVETHPYSVALATRLEAGLLRVIYGRHGGDSVLASLAAAALVDNVSLTVCQSNGSLSLPVARAELLGGTPRLLRFKGFNTAPVVQGTSSRG